MSIPICPKCAYKFHVCDLVCDRCGWIPDDTKELLEERAKEEPGKEIKE